MSKPQKQAETETIRQRVNGVVTRAVDTSLDNVNAENRTLTVSFSSELPYLRQSWWDEPWVEVLGNNPDEVDLSRVNSAAPVLYNHRRDEPSLRLGVIERAWVKNKRGYAEIKISRRDEVQAFWQDIQDGILKNISVGYQINERVLTKKNKDAPDEYRVTSWTPMEVSFVDIPADYTVGVDRNFEIINLDNRSYTMAATTEAVDTNEPQTTEQPNAESIRSAAKAEFERKEQSRRDEIRSALGAFSAQHQDVIQRAMDDMSITVDTARAMMLEATAKNVQSLGGTTRVQAGESESDKFREGAMNALLVRSGVADRKQHAENGVNNFRGYTLLELARHCLEINNINARGLDKREVVARAFTLRSDFNGHSTSDFTSVLANVAEKSMMKGYDEADETFQLWTTPGTASDFKTSRRVDLNAFPSLSKIQEGGEYTYGTVGDRGETVQLATYGKKFSITRQAIINDDLNAFTKIPMRMGRAAIRTIGDLVYAILTDNPAMSDSVALFHADHDNLLTGAAISTTSVDAMITAMAKQKDASNNSVALNIRLAHLLVPYALRGTAAVVANSEYEVGATNRNNTVPNSVRGLFDVIADARLDAASSAVWYGSANQAMHDTVEVTYLDGNSAPYIETKDGWDVDGAEFKVRIDAAVSPLDFRTLAKNPGA